MVRLLKYFKYGWYVLKHKFWVAYYCYKNGIVWRGIIHDWSKLLPSEFIPYSNKFYGNINAGRDKSGHYNPLADKEFQGAWHHHTVYNKHHWQYWTVANEDGSFICVYMPEKYVLEMICDWLGASRAQDNNSSDRHTDFYDANINNMYFHEDSKKNLEFLITRVKL